MNGVYDFEQYPAPYLDVEMLMEREMQKRKRKLLVLLGIAMLLMAIMAVMLLYILAKESKELFIILYIAFGVYIILGTWMLERLVKKGEYLCES